MQCGRVCLSLKISERASSHPASSTFCSGLRTKGMLEKKEEEGDEGKALENA